MVAVDDDITSRLTKAGCAFGKLQDRLWRVHSISLSTKIVVYRAVVLTSLLYGSETWTLYQHQIRKLDQFHMRCLHSIARIKWQDNQTLLCWKSVASLALRLCSFRHNSDGLVTLYICQILGFQTDLLSVLWAADGQPTPSRRSCQEV